MEYLFINPPSFQYTPAPITGVPTLIGILSSKGINSKYIDLNLDFINKMLKGEYISEYINTMDFAYNNPQSEIATDIAATLESNKHSWEFYKKNLLLLKQKSHYIYNVLSSDKIYNPVLYRSASIVFRAGLLSFYSSLDRHIITHLIDDLEDCRSNCEKSDFSIDISYLLSYLNCNINSLKKYYNDVLNNIISGDEKCIGICIGHYFQFLPGMLLGYLLKNNYNNIHINIGGAFFNDYYKQINNLSELFNLFFDTISIDDNTKTVFELIEYLNGKRKLSDIENLISYENGNLNINQTKKTNNINDLPFQEFNGYEEIDYIIPKLYLPIRTSYGCYWHKCIFCMCSNSNVKFSLKPVNKIVEEIEYLSKKYKTNHFYFWDNSLHPRYLEEMADLLIKKKLNIKYSIYARFEKDFNYKILKKLKKSGCLLIYWGLDGSSDRVLKYINKGITTENTMRVLKDAKKAAIANIVFIIFGHPTETVDDLENAYNFSKKIKNFVQEITVVAKCLFVEGSILQENRDYYKPLIYTTQEQRENIGNKIQSLFDKFNGIHSIYYLLYLEKYGERGCDLCFKLGQKILKNKSRYMNLLYKLIIKVLYLFSNKK